MNKTFKKIFSVCSAVVTTLTATLCHSTNPQTYVPKPKIVFAGPKASGKTNLASSICGDSYNSGYASTTGMDFVKASPLEIWDTSGDRKFLGLIDGCFTDAHLCVLSISDKTQDTEDFLNIIAKKNVQNVVLCITKTDEGEPDNDAISELLVKITQQLPQGVKVFDEVLYTSAKDNTFRFCTPDKYKTSDTSRIYDTEAKKQVLAAKLYELCGRKAEDFESETYTARTLSYDEYKTTTSKGGKYAFYLGIPVALLTLISGTTYYEYYRHFSEQKNTKTKTNPDTASAK